MSQQNNMTATSNPSNLPVKRKRGRPHKENNLFVKENSQLTLIPTSDDIQNTEESELNQSTDVDENMVGQVVSGVIEGNFDFGYLLSVKIGNNNTLMHGVIFQPGRVSPIIADDDIDPDVKPYKMRESPLQVVNPSCQANGSISRSIPSIEQPLQLENKVPPVLQSSAPIALSDSSTSIIFPLNNMPQNDNGSSLAGKIAPAQKSEFKILSESSSITMPLTNVSKIEAHMSMEGMIVNQQQYTDSKLDYQLASTIVHMPNMPNNISSVPLDVGKVELQPTPQFESEDQSPHLLKNLKVVEQDEAMHVFEAQALKPVVGIISDNKTSDQLPLVPNHAEKSEVDLHYTSPTSDTQFLLPESQIETKPCQTRKVHDDIHHSNLEVLQTPVVTYTHLVPIESEQVEYEVESSEPMDIINVDSSLKINEKTLVYEPQPVISEPTSEQMDIVKDMQVSPTKGEQSELAKKDFGKHEMSQNGRNGHDVVSNTEVVDPLAKLVVKTVLSGVTNSKIAISPINNTDMDFQLVETQYQW